MTYALKSFFYFSTFWHGLCNVLSREGNEARPTKFKQMKTSEMQTNGLGLVMYQVNTKGEAVPKVGGCETEREAVEYTIKRLITAKKMPPKEGAKYLRVLQISRTQPVYFDSFKNSRLKRLGKVRLGEFVDRYELATLYVILEDIKAEK
jgi:hypothetical protein